MTHTTHPTVTIRSAIVAVKAIVSDSIATAIVNGIRECEATGNALTDLQQIHFSKMLIMEYHDIVSSLEHSLEVEAELREMRL